MKKTTELSDFLCGVQLRVLPDFLLDHTLLNEDPDERLKEFHSRWSQFIDRLWTWQGATFCLRFVSDPVDGSVQIFFLGKATSAKDRSKLRRDIEFALVAYGIVPDLRDSSRCLRILTTEEIETEFSDDPSRLEMRRQVEQARATALQIPVTGSKLWAVTQEVTDGLWKNARLMDDIRAKLAGNKPQARTEPLKEDKPLLPWLPLVYQGAVGSFLVPFKALAASPMRSAVSVYLQPTQALDVERLWIESLGKQARVANQPGQQSRNSDPAAEPVERLCARIVASVLRKPFLISVLCAAVEGGSPADEMDHLTGALARTIQAVCCERIREKISPDEMLDPAPGAAATSWDVDDRLLQSYRELNFPLWPVSDDRPRELQRLDYLCDGPGAASVFRLPVSTGGGVCGVEVRQPAPTFVPGPSATPHEIGATGKRMPARSCVKIQSAPRTISLGRFEGGGDASIDIEALLKHMLVSGFTGSGKTNTVLNVLDCIWNLAPRVAVSSTASGLGPNGGGVPFLVIESAKQEYRGLLGIPAYRDIDKGLLIYTLGNETVAPFRLNPFALLPGVRVEAHISRLQACFVASLPPLPFLPSVISEALEGVYRRQWWTLTDAYDPDTRFGRRFPRLSDFYNETEIVLNRRGYAGDIGANVLAATKGRIKQLMLGSMGFMLEVEDDSESVSPDRLFTQPTVLELNDLNHEDKALVMMFVLMLLREYRELHPSNRLTHVTVIEEAHNVLGRVESQGTGENAGADTRAKAVEAFCNMLAEVRSLGEGLIISDQSPNKLAPDAMRNTNVQISHQLRDSNDRDSFSSATIMDEEQRDFLGKLPPGQAAVFFTGLQKATFLTAPDFRSGAGEKFAQPTDPTVRGYMAPLTGYRRLDLPFAGCQFCGKRKTCDYRDSTMKAFADSRHDLSRRYRLGMNIWRDTKGPPTNDGLKAVTDVARDASKIAGHEGIMDAAWCGLVHGWSLHGGNWHLTAATRSKFVEFAALT